MELTKLRIADLEEHEENYNTHPPEQVVQLEGSLEMFEEYFEGGQYKNVVVCKGKVLAGNGLVMAARNRGEEFIDAQVNDNLPDDVQRALIVADNATPAGALPDAAKLKSIFDQLDPFSIPGVTQEWMDSIKVMATDDIDIDSFFVESDKDKSKNNDSDSDTMICPHCGEIIQL